jgi:Tfp pilus assembly protein PilF
MCKLAGMLVAVAGASLIASSAHSQAVTVLGGGLARQCAEAALAGESDASFERTCTVALATESLDYLDRAGTYVNRGVMKLRRKEFAEAQLDFTSAMQTKPDFGEAYVNRGAALIGARRFAEGVADLDKAIALGVQEPEKAFYNRALANEHLDHMAAAYRDYMKAIELKPEWEQPRKELARFTVERP